MTERPEPVLHMVAEEDWRTARSAGRVEPASLASEGFVHCSRGWLELANAGNRHYAADPRPYVALELDLERVRAPWRYDDPARLYPHVYGPIPLAAVVAIRRLPRDPRGRFLPPSEARMNSLEPLLERLEAAGAQLASTRGRVEDGWPWPVGAVAEGGGEGEWGPTEVLAHVSEMLPFWLGEMERIVAGNRTDAAELPAFGRTSDDQVRGLTIVRDSTLPPRELFDRIASVLQRYRWRLPELREDEIARRGRHPVRGEVSVTALLETLVVSHLEGHAEQLDGSLRG
jgi:uncharacterized protein (DUF952 family)